MYKRWRHTRGYGVHSPFAYNVVKEVVRPKLGYGYYGYEDIDCAVERSRDRHARRHARMLLRLAAFLDVDSTFLPNDHRTSPFRVALSSANSAMKITSALAKVDSCRLVTTTGDYIPLDTLKELLAMPGRILCVRDVPGGWREQLFAELPEGLMLYGKHHLIIVHRTDMAKVSYSVRI